MPVPPARSAEVLLDHLLHQLHARYDRPYLAGSVPDRLRHVSYVDHVVTELGYV